MTTEILETQGMKVALSYGSIDSHLVVSGRLEAVKSARVIVQQFFSHVSRDVIAIAQNVRGSFRAIGVRVVGRKHEKVFADFFDDLAKRRLVAFAAEKFPTGFKIVTGRMADQIFGAITWIVKVVVHALDMGGNPTDTALEKGKFQILISIQQARAKHTGESGHDRKDARQDAIGKMVLE